MLSRVAEHIYWLARYLERAENTARLVSVHAETRLDWPEPDEFAWKPILGITGTLEAFEARGLPPSEEDTVGFLLSDPQNPSSLLSICAKARENNRTLIEILPRESWEEVNELHQLAAQPGASRSQQRGEHLREVIGRAQAMAGLFLGALNDDEGYAFLRLGRAIERGDFAIRVMLGYLEVMESGTGDALSLREADWVSVLRSLTAFQMYRRSVQGPITGPRVLRFLTCSTVFPRSVSYCAKEAGLAIARLPRSDPQVAAAALLSTELVNEHCQSGDETGVSAILRAIQDELAALHEVATATYFVPQPGGPACASQYQTQTTS